MTLNLREMTEQPGLLAPGHGLCPGCAESIIVRQVLQVAGPNTVVVNGTGCLEVSTTRYPTTAWRLPWIHNAFENAAATAGGVEAAYKAMARKGRWNNGGTRGGTNGRPNLVVFAGDGGTYDIGLQSLSGAIERGHRFLYVCLNNEAYMNTGVQRSGATPLGSWTTTTPVGAEGAGKQERRKDLTRIIEAHDIPYAAQASPHHWKDLMRKVEKGLAVDGPSFINVLSPCPRGWQSAPDAAIDLGKAAADTCVWPLYEVESGRWSLNYKPRQKKPVDHWLQSQGRFQHLLQPENRRWLEAVQADVDRQWEQLLARCNRSIDHGQEVI